MSWLERLSNFATEKNCLMILASLFILVAVLVAVSPYDPSADLPDATTNDIWVEQYSNGVHNIPYDEWTYGNTQSVIVEYQGEFVVVNEKGPGLVAMLLPFYMTGLGVIFGPLMMGLALLGTYMLGKRLFSWPVGLIASLFVLFNLTAIAMWHRYYWTDASTMHLLVLALWLLVEGNYYFNGRSMDPENDAEVSNKDRYLGLGICILSGLVFGASVSTRYPTGLLVFAFIAYIIGFFFLRIKQHLRKRRVNLKLAFMKGLPSIYLLGAFAIGLIIVLIPLTQYNSTYFGGPFNSGYDATPLFGFDPSLGLDVRNATTSWSSNIASYVSIAIGNFIALIPTFLSRMPALFLLPLGIYFLWNRKMELAVLLLWIGINFFTYLSLDWVDMYARPDLVAIEPRYWMPSVPAIAIIGALGLHQMANWLGERQGRLNKWPNYERKAAKIFISGAIAGIIVLSSAIPAVNYLHDPVIPSGRPTIHAELVTTDMLLANPIDYLDKPVILEDVIITSVSYDSIAIRSQNSSNSNPITVRLIEWPPGALPNFQVDQHIWLRGMFMTSPNPLSAEYHIGVKFDTQDYVRLSS